LPIQFVTTGKNERTYAIAFGVFERKVAMSHRLKSCSAAVAVAARSVSS
jgi:hypothetical protein